MSVPFNASKATPEMVAPEHRICVQYNRNGRRKVSVNQALLRPVGATKSSAVIHPIRESVRPQLISNRLQRTGSSQKSAGDGTNGFSTRFHGTTFKSSSTRAPVRAAHGHKRRPDTTHESLHLVR